MPRLVHTSRPVTHRQLRATLPFGLRLEHLSARALPSVSSTLIAHAATPGRVVLLTGPSGSGKSVALRALASRLDQSVTNALDAPRSSHTRLIDAFGQRASPEAASRLLASFGLAEPALFARTLGELSQGQLSRAVLAMAFQSALDAGAHWLLIDEFASVLDRTTARALAATLARAVASTPLRVVCATAHDDLSGALHPVATVRCTLAGEACIEHPRASAAFDFIIEPGTRADLDALLDHHYLAGEPATCVHVLRAINRDARQLAGVLAISMPTRNGVWRSLAWPGRYTGSDRRAALARLNAEVRCISRVIVDPRYRGLGLARRLVAQYLSDPLSPATEAVAAMGNLCPFFSSAGMTAYALPVHAADARLADALCSIGLDVWALAEPSGVVPHPLMRRELEHWARVRHLRPAAPADLAHAAAVRLCARPMAYAHVNPPRLSSASEADQGDSCPAPHTQTTSQARTRRSIRTIFRIR